MAANVPRSSSGGLSGREDAPKTAAKVDIKPGSSESTNAFLLPLLVIVGGGGEGRGFSPAAAVGAGAGAATAVPPSPEGRLLGSRVSALKVSGSSPCSVVAGRRVVIRMCISLVKMTVSHDRES